MHLTKSFVISTLERAALTFVTTFVSLIVLPFSISDLKSAAAGGAAAVVSFVISAIANLKTGTASLVKGIEVGSK